MPARAGRSSAGLPSKHSWSSYPAHQPSCGLASACNIQCPEPCPASATAFCSPAQRARCPSWPAPRGSRSQGPRTCTMGAAGESAEASDTAPSGACSLCRQRDASRCCCLQVTAAWLTACTLLKARLPAHMTFKVKTPAATASVSHTMSARSALLPLARRPPYMPAAARRGHHVVHQRSAPWHSRLLPPANELQNYRRLQLASTGALMRRAGHACRYGCRSPCALKPLGAQTQPSISFQGPSGMRMGAAGMLKSPGMSAANTRTPPRATCAHAGAASSGWPRDCMA